MILKTACLSVSWTIQLAPFRNKRVPCTLFPPFSLSDPYRCILSAKLYRAGCISVSKINISQSYTSLNVIAEAHSLALDSVGFTKRKGGDSYPCISVCFICTSSSQVIIVSPLKWNMLRFFHHHN